MFRDPAPRPASPFPHAFPTSLPLAPSSSHHHQHQTHHIHRPTPLPHSHSHSLSFAYHPPTSSPSPSSPLFTPSGSKPRARPPLRPKAPSTPHQRKDLQLRVEHRAKGFGSVFALPVGRGVPPAPPSSPVAGQRAGEGRGVGGGGGGADYFGEGWWGTKGENVKREEVWVEDARGGKEVERTKGAQGEGMDVDM